MKNDPEAALTAATENWEDQKEPSDARILIEAALGARNYEAARPVVDWISNVGLVDLRLRDLVEEWRRNAEVEIGTDGMEGGALSPP